MTAPVTPRRVAMLAAVCTAPLFAVQLKSWDVWWHLATGRWMVQHGTLPTTDPFTYTMQGEPWRLVNGLGALVLYGFHAALGPSGVVLAKMVFAALTLSLVGLSLRAVGARRGLVVAGVITVGLLVQARYSLARPLIIGAALVAAGTLALVRFEQGRERALLFFAIALPLWPLVHGTALVGLAQLVFALALAVVAVRRIGPSTAPPPKRAALLLGAMVVVTLAAHWWRELFQVATGLGQGVSAMEFTDEWRTGAEAASDHVGRWLFMGLGLVGAIVTRRERMAPIALSLLGLALASRFGRNAYEGVLLCAPGVAAGLEHGAQRLQTRGTRLIGMVAPVAAVLVLGAIQLATAPRRTISRPFGFGVAKGRYPDDVWQTLNTLPVARLIHGFPLGGYLIWRESPWGVYCDGRTVALYREDDIERLFMPLMRSDVTLTASARTHDAWYGLAQNGSLPQQWMMVSNDWVPLHLATGTVLFVRSDKLDQMPADVVPLHLVRYTTDVRWTRGFFRGIVADQELRRQLASELMAAYRRGPESPHIPAILRTLASLDPAYTAELETMLLTQPGGS
jgi:hypothetical protein